jgi:hypothetical protein
VHYKTGIWSPNDDTRDGETENTPGTRMCDCLEQGDP